MLVKLRHAAALKIKRLLYGSRGEPYRIAGHVLRYQPGSRPVRARYARSINNNVRYDALQAELFASELSEGDFRHRRRSTRGSIRNYYGGTMRCYWGGDCF
jgi:hypothetical protein